MSTISKPKEVSSCCGVKYRINLAAKSPDDIYWCTSCGQHCDAVREKKKPAARISPYRKPTGERSLFIQLYAKCKGKSQVSGAPLLPPEHNLFHWQGSHLLAKGRYPDYRLDERNIVMMTPDEHQLWHDKGPDGLRYTWGWIEHVKTFDKLKAEAETK